MQSSCWMAKAICSVKIWVFRSQFNLLILEIRKVSGLGDINIFWKKVSIEIWLLTPLAPQTTTYDLNLLQSLHCYLHPKINAATLCKMAGHLWYPSEDLILLSLFDPDINLDTNELCGKHQGTLKKKNHCHQPVCL